MSTESPSLASSPELAVHDRYASAAQAVEPALCCPVTYDGAYLAAIPQEVIERDYGCGDPSPFVRPGDTVVDLGSGGGKLCFIAAQIVGPAGKVIGVDCNPEMLGLARRHVTTVAERIGHANVEFRHGLIQDLALDLDRLAIELKRRPVATPGDWLELRSVEERLRRTDPLIPDATADCVISNCVLNLVRRQDRRQLFAEIFRVLKDGGRAAISDIVSDREIPARLQADPTLWSGCLSGAFHEEHFLQAFADAGFHGMEIVRRQSEPWQIVEGIEFRSLTVVAYKGRRDPGQDRKQSVIYRGPFSKVADDDGHVFLRGQRLAVGDETYRLLQRPPYQKHFEAISADDEILKSPPEAEPVGGNFALPVIEGRSVSSRSTAPPTACCSPGQEC